MSKKNDNDSLLDETSLLSSAPLAIPPPPDSCLRTRSFADADDDVLSDPRGFDGDEYRIQRALDEASASKR